MEYDKRCPYSIRVKDFDWRIKLCKLQNCEPTFCPEVKEDCLVYLKEYNTDTSAHHPTCNDEDDDIVRTCIKNEVQELVDKEPLR